MSKALCTAGILLAILLAGGCSGGSSDDGIPSADKAAAASANAIAVSVGGDYDKLTPDQKKQFIGLAGGERRAREMVNMMAHPPVHSPAAGPAGSGPAAGPHPPGGG